MHPLLEQLFTASDKLKNALTFLDRHDKTPYWQIAYAGYEAARKEVENILQQIDEKLKGL